MPEFSLPRPDLCKAPTEVFRPPGHCRPRTARGRLWNWFRRLVDLQFGSIWHDLASLLPAVEGTIVDVGSGAQPFRDLLSHGVRYVAVDIAESSSRFGYETADTRYYEGSVLPIDDQEANTVLCTETIEHVRDVEIFLGEVHRILAQGGHLILTVPFSARWHFIPHDYWRFTPSALLHLLSSAGFVAIRIYARGGALTVAAYKSLAYIILLQTGQGCHGANALVMRFVGFCLTPVAILATVIGNIGLLFPGSTDDTLGYTVIAQRSGASRV